MNKLKTKIYIALISLLTIIVALGIFGSLFISQLAKDSRLILKDNYQSIEYVSGMLRHIDNIYDMYISKYFTNDKYVADSLKSDYIRSIEQFEKNLHDETGNITEAGEHKLTQQLRSAFHDYRNLTAGISGNVSIRADLSKLSEKHAELRAILFNIQQLNMQAIRNKNRLAQQTAARVSFYMAISCTAGGLFALALLYFFPGYLLSPLYELTGKMNEISRGKFNQKLIVNSSDEIGELANAFNRNISGYVEQNTAKTQLIATISHELKTPISSINLSLKLLENIKLGSLNPEQKKVTDSIRQQTHRLTKMVNELLDYSAAESGNIRLRISDNHPSDIVDYAATALMVLLAEKEIQLETIIPEELPMVHIDIEKTVWVLTNLITNAERYTPRNGAITISLNHDNDFVVFCVSDEGPGIPKEEHENIFNKFVQVGDINSKGRGLGLAISREFVLAQGGNIWLRSELGSGSTFYFTLPVSKEIKQI